MSRTALLACISAALLVVHFFPAAASIAWAVAIAAGTAWLAATGIRYYRYFKARRAKAALLSADEAEFRCYAEAVDAVRASGVSTAQAEHEFDALQRRHKAMLDRRFGPH